MQERSSNSSSEKSRDQPHSQPQSKSESKIHRSKRKGKAQRQKVDSIIIVKKSWQEISQAKVRHL